MKRYRTTPHKHRSGNPCILCGVVLARIWYDGPTCRGCHRRKTMIKQKIRDYQQNCKACQGPIIGSRYHGDTCDTCYHRQLYHRSTTYRLRTVLRARLNAALRGKGQRGSAIRNLGCSIPELQSYIESKFLPGMSWKNWGRGTWHIDHMMPLSSFDLSDPQQLKKACHYTNLQPLWAKDNLRKSNKI